MVAKKINKKKFSLLKIVLIIIVLVVILIVIYFYFNFIKSDSDRNVRVIENPLKKIVLENTNEKGEINKDKVVQEAIVDFNEEYINYILIALGVSKLQTSPLGYGNPKIELHIDEEAWSSEVIDGELYTQKQFIDDEDAIIYMSKEEVVEALLSSHLRNFMINSVKGGDTKIEMIADNTELFTKGYLKMYQELTG